VIRQERTLVSENLLERILMMKMRHCTVLLAGFATVFSLGAYAQEGAKALPVSAGVTRAALTLQSAEKYTRPTAAARAKDYFIDSFGPFAILAAAAAGGVSQANNNPREWHQGLSGYGDRFGSAYGQAAITGTAKYALAEILRMDTRYYHCECTGFFPRLGHAIFSNLTARMGDDGHRVFSVPSVASPFAGGMGALMWYPDRYGPKDGLRFSAVALAVSFANPVMKEFIFKNKH
jgi:hypothetical protein